MAEQADLLQHLNVTSACRAAWDCMTGNEQVRFCDHCHLSVHNLSEMTPKEVLRLVIRSRGRLCVRYRRGTDGVIETADLLPARLHQIKRRATRIAAGAFTAALSLSSTAATAQTNSSSGTLSVSGVEMAALKETTRSPVLKSQGSTIKGLILDPAGAAIAGAKVTLTNEQTGIEQTATTNEEGEFRFQMLEAGSYTLKVEQAGFKAALIERVVVNGGDEQTLTANLEIGDHEAVTMGIVDIVEPSVPLVKAAFDNDMAALKELIDAGADVNAIDELYQASALMMAVAGGNLEMVQLLLWAGAEVNVRNSRGETPLMYLSERSTFEVAKALLAAGAKIDLQDKDGETALMTLATFNNGDVMQALIDAGAAVNMKNNKGETALILAASEDIIENVKTLIRAGADLYERDAEGRTALTCARENKNTRMVKLLRMYGAVEYLR
ncbi:MAG TPA: ankyrin repeat domain-containing protein [Pyrinomonadaceae bacterium]|jgi:hypothetical protein